MMANIESEEDQKRKSQDQHSLDVFGIFDVCRLGMWREIKWTKAFRENLRLEYTTIFPRSTAKRLFAQMDREFTYYEDALSDDVLYGNTTPIQRQHVVFGEEGVQYTFSGSGLSVPVMKWTPLMVYLSNCVENLCYVKYNFALVDRYNNGDSYISYQQNETFEVETSAPVVTILFGQERDYMLHPYAKSKKGKSNNVAMRLRNGSLIMLYPPSHQFWIYGFPKRKSVKQPSISITFFRKV